MNCEKPVARLLGKAKTSPEATALSLYARSRGAPISRKSGEFNRSKRSSRGREPTADPLDAKREAAEIQSAAAKLVMTRHKTEELRDALVQRDKHQAEIGAAAVEVIEQLASVSLEKEIVEAITADLGDLQAEALRVTR